MNQANTIVLPTTLPELTTFAHNTIKANRHLAAQNGRLIIENEALTTALGEVMRLYKSEDGQALLDLIGRYCAAAEAQMATDKAAAQAGINLSKRVH